MTAPTYLPGAPLNPALETKLVGQACAFDEYAGPTPGRRLVGTIERAKFVGLTVRGLIPDYALAIRGASGALMVGVSLVEQHVLPRD